MNTAQNISDLVAGIPKKITKLETKKQNRENIIKYHVDFSQVPV